jgi:hypothetical protein
VLRGVSFTPNPTLDHYTATIDWGDGSPASQGAISLSGSTFTVTGNHTYTDEGTFKVTTTITHQGISTTVTGTATVSDPAVVPAGGFVFHANEAEASTVQTVATFTDPAGVEPNPGDPGTSPDPYVATVQWGDGKTSTATLANGGIVLGADGKTFSVKLAHTYAEEGHYIITTSVNHEGVASGPVVSEAVVNISLQGVREDIALDKAKLEALRDDLASAEAARDRLQKEIHELQEDIRKDLRGKSGGDVVQDRTELSKLENALEAVLGRIAQDRKQIEEVREDLRLERREERILEERLHDII